MAGQDGDRQNGEFALCTRSLGGVHSVYTNGLTGGKRCLRQQSDAQFLTWVERTSDVHRQQTVAALRLHHDAGPQESERKNGQARTTDASPRLALVRISRTFGISRCRSGRVLLRASSTITAMLKADSLLVLQLSINCHEGVELALSKAKELTVPLAGPPHF